MALNNELTFAFYEARQGNQDSLNYLVNYFIGNVTRQLININLDKNEQFKKISQSYQVFFRNLNTCYDANEFINKTLDDLKKVIYLDSNLISNSSKEVLIRENDNIRKLILKTNLDTLNLPIVFREVARMHYIEQKSVLELAQIFKCSETIIYFRLRKVADAVLNKNTLNKERTRLK